MRQARTEQTVNAGYVNANGELEAKSSGILRLEKALRLAQIALILAIISAILAIISIVLASKNRAKEV